MDLTPLPVYLANPLRPRTVVGRVGRVAVEAGAEQDAVRVVVLELGRHLLRGRLARGLGDARARRRRVLPPAHRHVDALQARAVDELRLGFGRIVASEIEVPNM